MHESDDKFEAELDEREDPDAQDADWNLDPAVVDCPICGGEITEESEYCPHCKNYVVKGASRRKPMWFVAAAVLLIAVILVVWVMRGR